MKQDWTGLLDQTPIFPSQDSILTSTTQLIMFVRMRPTFGMRAICPASGSPGSKAHGPGRQHTTNTSGWVGHCFQEPRMRFMVFNQNMYSTTRSTMRLPSGPLLLYLDICCRIASQLHSDISRMPIPYGTWPLHEKKVAYIPTCKCPT